LTTDLRPFCPEVTYQGDAKTCYSKAAKFAFELIRRKYHNDYQSFSSQFINYNARLNRGATDADVPSTADDTLLGMEKYGVCLESDFPYSIDDYAESPAPQIYINAQQFRIVGIEKLNSLMDIWDCLDAGYPVIFNYMQHTSQFVEDVEASGLIPMPKVGDARVSSHAVCAVGYDIENQHIVFANSYGDKWGDHGYGYLPFDFIRNPKLAGYFRTFRG